MPTVTLNLRREVSRGPFTKRALPYPEQVELDDLTPKARAFAEAIADCPGAAPLRILWASGRKRKDGQNFRLRYGTGPDADAKGEEPEVAVCGNWSPLPADSLMTAVEWLEREVRTMPVDAYPLAAAPLGGPRGQTVPTAAAAAQDRYLVRENVLDYLRNKGHPLDVTAWDTLTGTGHLPEPDRYVCRQPQWKPETIDAFLAREEQSDLWPISQVAKYLGYSGSSATGSARKQLHRWGITPAGRAPGRGGENLYPADQVKAAHASRPGRGYRSDLSH
ncbi:hypothetical protein ACF1DY_26325 [Streptomyces albus]